MLKNDVTCAMFIFALQLAVTYKFARRSMFNNNKKKGLLAFGGRENRAKGRAWKRANFH